MRADNAGELKLRMWNTGDFLAGTLSGDEAGNPQLELQLLQLVAHNFQTLTGRGQFNALLECAIARAGLKRDKLVTLFTAPQGKAADMEAHIDRQCGGKPDVQDVLTVIVLLANALSVLVGERMTCKQIEKAVAILTDARQASTANDQC